MIVTYNPSTMFLIIGGVPMTGVVTIAYEPKRRAPFGASIDTLERRVRYGGRKGRRAARRLQHRPLPPLGGPITIAVREAQ
jgi:hypothetical protein